MTAAAGFLQNGAGEITDIALQIIGVLAVFGILLVVGLYGGRSTLVAGIFSLYVAIPLYGAFPYKNLFIQSDTPEQTAIAIDVAIFLVTAVFLFILLRKIVSIDIPVYGTWRYINTALLALLGTAVAIAIGYHVLAVPEAYDFVGPLKPFLMFTNAAFWWLFAPLFFMFILVRR